MATNRVTTQFDFKSNGGLSKIKADVKEADGLFGKMKAGIRGVSEELKSNRVAQAGMATAAVAGAKVAIDAASGLEESINAVKVVYKDAGDEVLALGDNSAEAFGLSQRAFNEFAVQFSAFAQQIADNSGRSVIEVVEEMTTRVADFASVHNLSMEEAAQVVQSTMAGETEAFRRFGGDVSAATIKAKAYEDGIAEVGQELTEGQKVLARYSAFMEQTGDTAGDFANTADSLANQQRIMTANIEDSAAAIGKDLLPVVAEAAQLANDAASSFRDFDNAVMGLTGGKGTIGTALDIGTAPLRAMNEYNKALLGFVGIGKDANDEAKEFTRVQTDNARAQFEAATATEDATEAVEEHADRVSELNQWVDKAAYLQEQYQAATERAEAADQAAAQATEERRQRLNDLITALQRSVDSTFDYESASIQAERAANDFEQQLEDTKAVLDDNESSLRDKENALYDAREAEIAAAEQVWAAAQAFAAEQGAAEGSTESVRLQKEELQRLADKFPFLRDEIDLFIAKLNAIPSHKSVTVSVSQVGNVGVGGTIGGLGHSGARAAGGPVEAGGMYRVGEGGKPELLESGGQHYLIPGDQRGSVTPARHAGGGAGGGGGVNDVHLHFDARGAIGMNEQQVKRWIVETLRQHVRFNGSIKGVTG